VTNHASPCALRRAPRAKLNQELRLAVADLRVRATHLVSMPARFSD
jgi:hypothetical protein